MASVWPEVVPVARRELLGFRLSPETVEDLIQEAAAVVLRKRPDFEDGNDLAPYVRIVVRRLALHWLRDHRRESVGPVPDRPALHAVPDVVEGRMRLAGTVHAFKALQPGQRALLSEYIADRTAERAGDRRASVRERKQVQRLRTAMARVADGFAAGLAWLRLRFPWLEALPAHAFAVGVALSALVGALASNAEGGVAASTVIAAASEGSNSPWLPVTHVEPSTPISTSSVGQPHGGEAPSSAVAAEPGGPRPEEVIVVETPAGPTVGWELRPNSPEKPLVCAAVVGVESPCVPKMPFPTVPPMPPVRP